MADWRGYFRYKLLSVYAPDLPTKFVQLHFDFTQRTVSGIEEVKPRWKRAVDTVDGSVGDLVGKMYVERHFSPDAKRRMDELVGNLLAAYRQGIDSLEWMSPATKQKSAREAGTADDQDRLSDACGATGSKLEIRRRRSGRQRDASVDRRVRTQSAPSSAARSIAPNGS